MIKGINHIGIATSKLAEVTELYRTLLPEAHLHQETIEDQKVRVSSFSIGGAHIEFLEPTGPESPIAKYLEKNPQGGIHHLAVTTDDVAQEISRLKEAQFRMIDEIPRPGMGGTKIAFVHPKSSGGILLELTQE